MRSVYQGKWREQNAAQWRNPAFGTGLPSADRRIRIPLLLLIWVLFSAALSGCSNRQLYSAIRENRLQDCETYPVPQQAECRARYGLEFEEYERLREESGQQAASQ